MPKLDRSAYYDLTRDMNWRLRYVSEKEAFPEEQVHDFGVPAEAWWDWDEPYKVTYREYVYNQSDKDTSAYSVKAAIARSKLFDQLDAGWKAAVAAHYGAIVKAEFLASIGEARMARFGRAAAWRNMATFGSLDEQRHAQIQLYFAHGLLNKHPQFDWALKATHTENVAVIATRSLYSDMFLANDALSTAIELTYVFETGFTNLQFLGIASDAFDVGDVEFGSLISSIQTDESRHAQQGEPTLRILLRHGKKEEAQRLIDVMFWRSWRIFALLTGLSMDYYTPLEHRSMSFKEFMEEWIIKQFLDQFRDLGMERPWYWDIFLGELDWYHHAMQACLWFWRPTLWWNPSAGVAPEEREWLEAKYPGWNKAFGRHWDVITENIRTGQAEQTLPQTLPILCNLCQLPVYTPADPNKKGRPEPYVTEYKGRRYHFCSEPCKWIFDGNPERYAGHMSLVDRFLAGLIQPATLEGVLAYMGMTPDIIGQDADNYAWAFKQAKDSKAAAI